MKDKGRSLTTEAASVPSVPSRDASLRNPQIFLPRCMWTYGPAARLLPPTSYKPHDEEW